MYTVQCALDSDVFFFKKRLIFNRINTLKRRVFVMYIMIIKKLSSLIFQQQKNSVLRNFVSLRGFS